MKTGENVFVYNCAPGGILTISNAGVIGHMTGCSILQMWIHLQTLKAGGSVLVRDYGLHDQAMLRFGRGSKIDERFYVRQDGTRAYYFDLSELLFMCELKV